MECDDKRLLEEWAANWTDLVEFEFVPVRTSKQAAELVAPKLRLPVALKMLSLAKASDQRREFGTVLLAERGKF